MPKKLSKFVEDNDNNDRLVMTEFIKHPNRALAVPEVAILLGGQASFNIADSFRRLENAAKIFRTTNERHVGRTIGDEVVTSDRYRRVV